MYRCPIAPPLLAVKLSPTFCTGRAPPAQLVRCLSAEIFFFQPIDNGNYPGDLRHLGFREVRQCLGYDRPLCAPKPRHESYRAKSVLPPSARVRHTPLDRATGRRLHEFGAGRARPLTRDPPAPRCRRAGRAGPGTVACACPSTVSCARGSSRAHHRPPCPGAVGRGRLGLDGRRRGHARRSPGRPSEPGTCPPAPPVGWC